MIFRRRRQIVASTPPVSSEAPVFSLPDGVRIYAVGDIHGRSKLLATMLAAIEKDARANPTQRIIEVFLGDYIDRGLSSNKVVELLLAPSTNGHERICLMGNHEDALLQFLAEPRVLREWANFGGYATLAAYGIAIPDSMLPENLAILRDHFLKNLPEAHVAFFRNLKLSYSLGDYLFVHAGVHPHIPLHQQKPEHLLWIREPFLQHVGFFDRYIVHGHTPVAAPDIHSHRANLDVSGASTNSLCCLVIEGNKRRVMMVTDEND